MRNRNPVIDGGDERGATGTGRRRRLAAAVGAIAVAALALGGCISVSPSTGVNPAGQPLNASGAGFADALPVGIYVAFGPDPATLPADWFSDPAYFQTAVWVWQNGTGSATNKKMNADGSFGFALTKPNGAPITAVYTDGRGKVVDCRNVQCGVVTMKAHGSTDRSFDRFKPVTFAG